MGNMVLLGADGVAIVRGVALHVLTCVKVNVADDTK